MTGRQKFPWEGTVRCAGAGRSGLPCSNAEILGLEFCLHHVPDDLLEEAEEVTGFRRCRKRFGRPDACRYFAVKGTEPPMCKDHGAQVGSVQSGIAGRKVVQLRADQAGAALIAEPPVLASLLDPPPVGNPFEALLAKAAVACEWEAVTRRALAYLSTSNWRYANSRLGEQTRAEILLHQQALNTCLTALERICRLNIEAKLAGVRQQTADMLERALAAALESSGADLDGQARARREFREQIRVVA